MKWGRWTVCEPNKFKVYAERTRQFMRIYFNDFEDLKSSILNTGLINQDVLIRLINTFRLYEQYRDTELFSSPNPYIDKLITEWRKIRDTLFCHGLNYTFPIMEIKQDERRYWNSNINGTRV